MADQALPQRTFKSPAIHRTPLYRAYAAWYGFLARCGDPTGKNPSYRNVELRMTLEEWLAWAVPRYEEFIRDNPGVSPSVARKGDLGHYEIGNISIVSWADNRAEQKHPYKNPLSPDGTKKCSRCNEVKRHEHFPRTKKTIEGLESMCRDCKRAYGIKYRAKQKEIGRLAQ